MTSAAMSVSITEIDFTRGRTVLTAPAISNARRLFRFGLLAGAAALLGGCASFSADGGMGTIQSATYADIGKDVVKAPDDQTALTAKARVAQLLRKPLTADTAVQIALLNNRGLQAAFNELGMAEAQMVAASLPPNPRLGISKLSGRFEVEIERQIDVLSSGGRIRQETRLWDSETDALECVRRFSYEDFRDRLS